MTESLLPIWLVDIDSTLQVPPPHSFDIGNNNKKLLKLYAEWERVIIEGFHITYAPEVIAFINRMHESGLVEIQWLTTWKHLANTEFSPVVGLPEFPVSDAGGSDWIYPHENWWKYRSVEQHASVRPTIWTDDDITKEAAADMKSYAKDNQQESLVIRPAVSRGLEPSHLEQIEAFILTHSKNN